MVKRRAQPSKDGSTIDSHSASSASIAGALNYHGGPFNELQAKIGLLHDLDHRPGRRAVLFVGLAWGIPFLLSVPRILSSAGNVSYLTDPGVWGKFFIAIACFILAELQVVRGLRATLAQLVRAPLIAPTSIPRAEEIIKTYLRRRNSGAVEAVCLGLALVASMLSFANFHTLDAPSWAVKQGPGGSHITLAGWWSICFSLPLFVFLFARMIWQHLVSAHFLRSIAKLQLRLVATHPDGKAGLDFLARYPDAYSYFVFGMSCAVAAAVAKNLLQDGLSLTTFTIVLSGWLALVVAFFAYPLSAFTPPLYRLKQEALALLGAQATRYFRSGERKSLGRNIFSDPTAEEEADLPDPTKLYDSARKLSTILISRTAVVPVAAAAVVPFAAVGATQLPMKEVVSVLKKLLLL